MTKKARCTCTGTCCLGCKGAAPFMPLLCRFAREDLCQIKWQKVSALLIIKNNNNPLVDDNGNPSDICPSPIKLVKLVQLQCAPKLARVAHPSDHNFSYLTRPVLIMRGVFRTLESIHVVRNIKEHNSSPTRSCQTLPNFASFVLLKDTQGYSSFPLLQVGRCHCRSIDSDSWRPNTPRAGSCSASASALR